MVNGFAGPSCRSAEPVALRRHAVEPVVVGLIGQGRLEFGFARGRDINRQSKALRLVVQYIELARP